MRIDCALLCDFANVRGGLLTIVGGGVTRLRREDFPAPLGVELALRVMVHPSEIQNSHKFEARLVGEDGQPVGTIELGFQVEDIGEARPGEELALPFVADIRLLPLPNEGAYSFDCLIDGTYHLSVPFWAERTKS